MSTALTILSIDDSKAVHAFLDRCMADSMVKMNLIHATNPNDGIEILKKQLADINLVLLDWEMPEMTGPEVLAKVRSLGIQTPVIMLTSKNAPEDIEMMINAGASEYIMKPFTPDIVLDKIKSVLGL